jgi:hypothetical protein
MSELELIVAILEDLNSRIYMLESDEEGQGYDRKCNEMLEELRKAIPR